VGLEKVIIKNKKHKTISDIPQYGKNYDKGWIGFTFDKTSPVSKAIALATKYKNKTGIKISHALVVVGEGQCVEASANNKKVISSDLSKYFDDPNQVIIFQKPKELTVEDAETIAQTAISCIDMPYEFKQLGSHGVCSLPVVRRINEGTFNIIPGLFAMLLDNKNAFICSELAAYSLKSAKSWKYHNKGILRRPTCRFNPQELFEDKTIFEDYSTI
jgi:hypothetical protein